MMMSHLRIYSRYFNFAFFFSFFFSFFLSKCVCEVSLVATCMELSVQSVRGVYLHTLLRILLSHKHLSCQSARTAKSTPLSAGKLRDLL